MCIIIDNSYSRKKKWKKKQEKMEKKGERKRDEEEAYLFLFVPIFNVELIARYTGSGGKDSTLKRW